MRLVPAIFFLLFAPAAFGQPTLEANPSSVCLVVYGVDWAQAVKDGKATAEEVEGRYALGDVVMVIPAERAGPVHKKSRLRHVFVPGTVKDFAHLLESPADRTRTAVRRKNRLEIEALAIGAKTDLATKRETTLTTATLAARTEVKTLAVPR